MNVSGTIENDRDPSGAVCSVLLTVEVGVQRHLLRAWIVPADRALATALVESYATPNRVRELRIARGLSQRQLADMVGTQRSNISRLEGGGTHVLMRTAMALANALGVTIPDLGITVYGTEPAAPRRESA